MPKKESKSFIKTPIIKPHARGMSLVRNINENIEAIRMARTPNISFVLMASVLTEENTVCILPTIATIAEVSMLGAKKPNAKPIKNSMTSILFGNLNALLIN